MYSFYLQTLPRHCFLANPEANRLSAYLYGASALIAAASSGSHLSPLASNFSVMYVSNLQSLSLPAVDERPSRNASISRRTLVVKQLLASLSSVLRVGRLNDGIDWT